VTGTVPGGTGCAEGGVDCGADWADGSVGELGCGLVCAHATVVTANANAARIAALELLKDAVMTSPLVCC